MQKLIRQVKRAYAKMVYTIDICVYLKTSKKSIPKNGLHFMCNIHLKRQGYPPKDYTKLKKIIHN
jgi:hypothetical protein